MFVQLNILNLQLSLLDTIFGIYVAKIFTVLTLSLTEIICVLLW